MGSTKLHLNYPHCANNIKILRKMLKVVLLFLCLAVVSHAWVSTQPAPPLPNDLTVCVPSGYDNVEMQFGEEKKIPGTCILAKCHNDASMDFRGCGQVHIPKGCKFNEPDLTKDYPDCCESDYTCPEDVEDTR